MPSEFFMEIGCEEIPARTMARSLEDLRERVETLLRKEELGHDRVEALGSARRFVIRVPSLEPRQQSRTELTLGPPVKIAFVDGRPSPAMLGFARKNNIDVDALKTFSTDRGDYMGFETTIEGASAADILSRAIPEIVRAMSFPKMMIWVDPAQRFSRPVRWMIARHGDQPVPIEMFGVKSGSFSEGHRTLGRARVEVTSFDDFKSRLEENFVIVSQLDRREKIERELQAAAVKAGGRIVGDDRLLEEVVYINEYPTVLEGEFDPGFLELPREILITVMKEHQKYFGIEDVNGVLQNRFLAVMNTASDPKGYIRKGHERVLRARLTDALFFWNVDGRRTLEERRGRLKAIVFHEKLGSYADKVKRMVRLARKINKLTRARLDAKALQQAVEWSKSDLTTDMVREFTDLQGVVGGLYAKREGAPEDIWRPIYEHYAPKSLEDQAPESRAGAVLSITDKLDTVLACFSVDLVPTGSEDPLGLRRAMQGVIKTLLDQHLPFSFKMAAGPTPSPQLTQFYEDRLRFILGHRGFAYDEINAVAAVGCDDPSDTLHRLQALLKVRGSPDFEAVSIAFKRIKNILRQAEKAGETLEGSEIAQESLEPEETALASFLEGAKPKIEKLERRGEYKRILEIMAGARPAIDRFFEKIMVMHQDPAVRRRRLLLLTNLFSAFSRVADISEIVVKGEGGKI